MKFFIILLAFILIPMAVVAETPENKTDYVYHIGLSSTALDKFNRNDAIAALKAWTQTVIKEQGMKERAEVHFYNSLESLALAYKTNRVDAISLSAEDSMHLNIKPEFIYIPSREDGFHVRYAILVHRKNLIKDLKELKDKKLIIYDGLDMLLARLWVKSILNVKPSNEIENLSTVDNPSKAILQIFFRQADAAVVTSEAFELACELNPQLKKDIMVFSTSQPLVTSFFIFRSNWKGPNFERLESAIVNLHTTPGGRQVLNVFQSSRMEKHPNSVLDDTRQFLLDNQQYIENGPLK